MAIKKLVRTGYLRSNEEYVAPASSGWSIKKLTQYGYLPSGEEYFDNPQYVIMLDTDGVPFYDVDTGESFVVYEDTDTVPYYETAIGDDHFIVREDDDGSLTPYYTLN